MSRMNPQTNLRSCCTTSRGHRLVLESFTHSLSRTTLTHNTSSWCCTTGLSLTTRETIQATWMTTRMQETGLNTMSGPFVAHITSYNIPISRVVDPNFLWMICITVCVNVCCTSLLLCVVYPVPRSFLIPTTCHVWVQSTEGTRLSTKSSEIHVAHAGVCVT